MDVGGTVILISRQCMKAIKDRYCSPRVVSCKDGYTYYEMEYFLHHQNAQSHTHIQSLEYMAVGAAYAISWLEWLRAIEPPRREKKIMVPNCRNLPTT